MGTEHQVLVNVATVGRPSARPASFVEWAQDKQRCVLSGINILRPASADVKLLASSRPSQPFSEVSRNGSLRCKAGFELRESQRSGWQLGVTGHDIPERQMTPVATVIGCDWKNLVQKGIEASRPRQVKDFCTGCEAVTARKISIMIHRSAGNGVPTMAIAPRSDSKRGV
jgi:hypothetical protein